MVSACGMMALQFTSVAAVSDALPVGMQEVLDRHNLLRCMHGAPPLQWDDAIAASAQQWADTGTCDMLVHSQDGYGENIFWASPAPSPDKLFEGVDAWYDEIKVTADGETSDWCGGECGHYTQVVWASSTHIGCGTCGGTMVCQYSPPGNMAGDFEANVFKTQKSWEDCEMSGSLQSAPMPQVTQISDAMRAGADIANIANISSMPTGMQRLLDFHNIYRCMHGAQSLQWTDAIAVNAQTWATTGTCDKTIHSPESQRPGNGENIFWRKPALQPDELHKAAEDWYSEVQHTYDGETTDTCGEGLDSCGHYTQMVWKATTHLGCGTCDGTVVCQYSPQGNMRGQFEENVHGKERTWEECAVCRGDYCVPATFPETTLV